MYLRKIAIRVYFIEIRQESIAKLHWFIQFILTPATSIPFFKIFDDNWYESANCLNFSVAYHPLYLYSFQLNIESQTFIPFKAKTLRYIHFKPLVSVCMHMTDTSTRIFQKDWLYTILNRLTAAYANLRTA